MAAQQIWLHVVEGSEGEWPPSLGSGTWRVELSNSPTLQGCRLTAPFRSSPLFPAAADFALPQLESDTHYCFFLCFDPAFPVLARLIDGAPAEVRRGLCFSLGIASIVLVTREPAALEQVTAIAGVQPRSSETWRLERSTLVSVTSNLPKGSAPSAPMPLVESYESLPVAQRMAVDEFVSNIGLLAPKIALHLPSEQRTFTHLVGRVAELIQEMKYVSSPTGAPPETLSEYSENDFRTDRGLVEMILHQAMDRLVQINSALSYVSTQALSGAVPILERRSLIRRYSLLGVGTAILALTRIARAIEHAFAASALETILEERAADAAALPGLNQVPEYDSNDWPQHSVDNWREKVPAREPYPKLPYFSGRLGYRESEYTISAALQSLAAGAGPEWSLLTLTHEMVHGHVRNLLSIILQGDPARVPLVRWQEFYDQFAAKVKHRSTGRESLLDSLRTIIFTYCCMAATHGSITSRADTRRCADASVRLNFVLPEQPSELLLLLENELRNINEVLVHVLDFHYFYLSSIESYVPLIWRSWSLLAQVKCDLRQYLLRTLLVAATKVQGSRYDRFRQSTARVEEVLGQLSAGPWSGTPTIKAAVEYLRDDEAVQSLFFPFSASLILVDMAHHVLTSSVIRGSLNGGDPHLAVKRGSDAQDAWYEYAMPEGFVDSAVAAPTALLADRLAKKVLIGEADTLERETVMLFLACCSHSGSEGQP